MRKLNWILALAMCLTSLVSIVPTVQATEFGQKTIYSVNSQQEWLQDKDEKGDDKGKDEGGDRNPPR